MSYSENNDNQENHDTLDIFPRSGIHTLLRFYLLTFVYFTQSCKEAKTAKSVMLSDSETSHISYRTPSGDPSLTLRMTLPKCVALARQNARSDVKVKTENLKVKR